MYVVLDTNIWLKELALNSGAGSALRLFLRQKPAALVVPEVVQLEVERNLRNLITEAIEEVSEGSRRLLTLFGSMKEIVLPSAGQIDELVNGVFDKVGVEIVRVPFSLESATAAFLKTINKSPPSDKTQEFKDGVLWADCAKLLETDEVVLASQDKAFFRDHDYSKGLAANLLQEAAERPHEVALVSSVNDLLEHVKSDLAIDTEHLGNAVVERVRGALDKVLGRAGAETAQHPTASFEFFATEIPDRLYFTYSVTAPCSDVAESQRTNMKLTAEGNGMFDVQNREMLELHPGREQVTYTEPDGSTRQQSNVYASAHMFLGHKTIEHTVRHRIEGAG